MCVSVCVCVCLCVCVCVCVRFFLYACVRARTYIHVCMHTYAHNGQERTYTQHTHKHAHRGRKETKNCCSSLRSTASLSLPVEAVVIHPAAGTESSKALAPSSRQSGMCLRLYACMYICMYCYQGTHTKGVHVYMHTYIQKTYIHLYMHAYMHTTFAIQVTYTPFVSTQVLTYKHTHVMQLTAFSSAA